MSERQDTAKDAFTLATEAVGQEVHTRAKLQSFEKPAFQSNNGPGRTHFFGSYQANSTFTESSATETSPIVAASLPKRQLEQVQHQSLDIPASTQGDHGQQRPDFPSTNMHFDPPKIRSFMVEVQKFRRIQVESSILRVLLQQKRSHLATLRDKASQCDQALMEAVRTSVVRRTTPNPDQLSSLYEACQSARDSVGPVESECEELELRLGRIEYSLNEKSDMMNEKFGLLGGTADIPQNESSSESSSHISYETQSLDPALEGIPLYGSPSPSVEAELQPATNLPSSLAAGTVSVHPPVHYNLWEHATLPVLEPRDEMSPLELFAPDLSPDNSWHEATGLSLDINVDESFADPDEILLSQKSIISQGHDDELPVNRAGKDSGLRKCLNDDDLQFSHARVNWWLYDKLCSTSTEQLLLDRMVSSKVKQTSDLLDAAFECWDLDDAAKPPTLIPSISSASKTSRPSTVSPSSFRLPLPPYVHQYTHSTLVSMELDPGCNVTSPQIQETYPSIGSNIFSVVEEPEA